MPPANPPQPPAECPRCHSLDTKFCYFNNYNLSQPRQFCKSCRRYWTFGGTLRNVPVGGSTRRPGVAGSPFPPTKRRRRDPNGGKLAVRREEEAVVLKPEEVVVGDVRGSSGQVLAEPLELGEEFLKGGGCYGLDLGLGLGLGLGGVEEEMGFGVGVGKVMTWPFEGDVVVGAGSGEEASKGGGGGGDDGGFGSKEGKRLQ